MLRGPAHRSDKRFSLPMLLGMVPLSWLLLKDLHSEQAIAVNMNEPVRTCGFGRPERLPPPRARGGGGAGA